MLYSSYILLVTLVVVCVVVCVGVGVGVVAAVAQAANATHLLPIVWLGIQDS